MDDAREVAWHMGAGAFNERFSTFDYYNQKYRQENILFYVFRKHEQEKKMYGTSDDSRVARVLMTLLEAAPRFDIEAIAVEKDPIDGMSIYEKC